MSRTPLWIDRRTLLYLHEETLAEHGGAPGFLNEDAFDSALARPLNLHAYAEEMDLARLAAVYGYGLARNHAFVDGNKRVAFISVGVFLAINGVELVADQVDAIRVMLDVAAGKIEEQAFADWIRANLREVR